MQNHTFDLGFECGINFWKTSLLEMWEFLDQRHLHRESCGRPLTLSRRNHGEHFLNYLHIYTIVDITHVQYWPP